MRRAFAIAVLFAASCSNSSDSGVRHVVLISLDTVRADHLGCYGYANARTPNIDALAAQGVRFERAFTAAPTTLAAHTSLMTGTYPHTHGVPRNGFVAHPDNVTLAEILREKGYATAAFLGSFALGSPFGLKQGFEVYDERFDIELGTAGADQNQRRADKVTDAALGWFDEAKPARSFTFVHYFDAHAPYDPPTEFDRAGRAITLAELSQRALAHQRRLTSTPPGWEGALRTGLTRELVETCDGAPMAGDDEVVAQYDGEIAFIDSQVGRLLDGLKQRGVLEHALVVLVADHGETFYEHADFFNHGLWLYDTTLHVPLIVRAPAIAPRVESLTVSSVDVAPTILALAGIDRPASFEGVALDGVLRGATSFERGPVFSEATQPANARLESVPWMNMRKPSCAIDSRGKLIRAPYLDFEQALDTHDAPSPAANELRAPLAQWSRSIKPLPTHFAQHAADETRKRLAELGYFESDEK